MQQATKGLSITRSSQLASPRFAAAQRSGHVHHMRGFTLIEVMIVVVIVAILASIALPSYLEHIRKSRRVDAQSAMSELAQFMERYYTANNSYSGAILPTAVTGRVSEFYDVTLSAQTAQTYTLQAAPTARQSADTCGTLTVAHTGARTPGTAGCWN